MFSQMGPSPGDTMPTILTISVKITVLWLCRAILSASITTEGKTNQNKSQPYKPWSSSAQLLPTSSAIKGTTGVRSHLWLQALHPVVLHRLNPKRSSDTTEKTELLFQQWRQHKSCKVTKSCGFTVFRILQLSRPVKTHCFCLLFDC